MQQLTFISNTTLAAASSRYVSLVDVATEQVTDLSIDDADDSDIIAPIITISASKDGQWLAVGDLLNRIRIYSLETRRFYSALPSLTFLHTAISFHPSSTLVVSAGEELYFYNIAEQEFTPWSKELSRFKPLNYTTCAAKNAIVGIDFKDNTMLLWASQFLCIVDLSEVSDWLEWRKNILSTCLHSWPWFGVRIW